MPFDNKKTTPSYDPKGKDLEDSKWTSERIKTLKEGRDNVMGRNINALWRQADLDFEIRKLNAEPKVENVRTERRVVLQESNWQSDLSQPIPFVKVQTALSILVDRIPQAVLTPRNKQFSKTNQMMVALYQNNWETTKSLGQLRKFVFNQAKYGFAVARTYHRYRTRTIRELLEYDPTKDLKKFEEKEDIQFDDVYRENLNPFDVWIDEAAVPGDMLSVRDWAFRKVYDWDSFEQEFSGFNNFKFVSPGGNVEQSDQEVATTEGNEISGDPIEVIFYENQQLDLYRVEANGVLLINEPLPYAHKRLSCWFAGWNMRHAETIYGVGLPEIMRQDVEMMDRIRNMSMDQLLLSIYKMYFYSGSDNLSGDGRIVIRPGQGQQVLDPKAITFFEVPGPGREAEQAIERLKLDIDEATGITKPLAGELTGKTAFEVAQSSSSAMRRLKNPLDELQAALEVDGSLTIDLIKQIYSEPKVEEITDLQTRVDYLNEIEQNDKLFFTENTEFYKKVYREVWLELVQDEQGEFQESKEKNFFRILPEMIRWEGEVRIRGESVLRPSKELERQMKLEMANLLIPLLAQPQELSGKPARRILELYDEDPEDWLPDFWLQQGGIPMIPQMGAPAGAQAGAQAGMGAGAQAGAQQVVPTGQVSAPRGVSGLVRRAAANLNPFR